MIITTTVKTTKIGTPEICTATVLKIEDFNPQLSVKENNKQKMLQYVTNAPKGPL